MKNLFKALSGFQNECPIIHKDTQGYGYTYADLPAILDIINPLLKKHGLGFTQLGMGTSIKTIIFHVDSGEFLESTFDIPQNVSLKGMNEYQVLGSAITYMRRYALSSALGIVTDKDNDAQGQQIKKEDKKWLNPNTIDWSNAVSKKVDIKEVKKHYNISQENEKLYLKEIQK